MGFVYLALSMTSGITPGSGVGWEDVPGRGGKRMARTHRKRSLEHMVAGLWFSKVERNWRNVVLSRE
jgi:hypothetical protein